MFAAAHRRDAAAAAALDVTEKAVAEPVAFMGAFDQAGNVRQHEFAAIDADDPEMRMQRREGIIGDLRLGGLTRGEESRFAGIGQADEAGIGDELQAQPDGALVTLQARIGTARRPVGRGREMGIAEAAIAALGEDEALRRFRSDRRSAFRRPRRRSGCRAGLSSTASAPRPPARFLPMPWTPVLALKCC